MPQGENCEVGKAGDQRENNLQVNEVGSISDGDKLISSFCQSNLRIYINTFYYDIIKGNDFRSVDFRRTWVSSHSFFFLMQEIKFYSTVP